jgi:trk system potassium uptake protein TrkA
MARYAVIGLGIFGSNVARSLFEKGHDVIAIDASEEMVQRARENASQAVHADATDRETLEALGLRDVDYAVISVGEKIDASILITLHLAELGVRNIVVKAINETHGKILRKIGATEVVFPEKDIAVRIADRIGHKHVIDQIPLGDGITILELTVPGFLAGKSIQDARLRKDYSLNVIGIRELRPDGRHGFALARPDYVLRESDVLILVGPDDHVEAFKQIQS